MRVLYLSIASLSPLPWKTISDFLSGLSVTFHNVLSEDRILHASRIQAGVACLYAKVKCAAVVFTATSVIASLNHGHCDKAPDDKESKHEGANDLSRLDEPLLLWNAWDVRNAWMKVSIVVRWKCGLCSCLCAALGG